MNSAKYTQFENILNNEENALVNLIHVLQDEKANIEQNNLDIVEETSIKKDSILSIIENNIKLRLDFMDENQISQDINGVREWISKAPRQSEDILIAKWENLGLLLDECKQHNIINGCLIAVCHQQSQQLLDCLNNNPNEAQIYGKNGDKVTNKVSPPITKA